MGGQQQEEEKELKGQTAVLHHISQAQQHLQKAVAAGAASTPLVAEIPVFQQLTQMSKDLTPAMQAVAKMRGLG